MLQNNQYYNISIQCKEETLYMFFNMFNNPVHIKSNRKTYFLNITIP